MFPDILPKPTTRKKSPMNKPVKIILLIIVIVTAILIGGFKYLQYTTKQHSPEREVTYNAGGTAVTLYYNSPSVKDREIFGNLVPFGEVWRTGANEPTTVTFDREVTVSGTKLGAGTYSLWTIPGPETWEVILNTGRYDWGLGWGGKVPRDPELDAVVASAAVINLDELQEQLVIRVNEENPALELMWEYTMVTVPFEP